MENLKFTIPGNPITKKNSQRIVRIKNKSGCYFYKIMPSKAFEKYQKECGQYMPTLKKTINFPVNLKCTYYMKTKRIVDLPNLYNATCDILVHYGILEDDKKDIVYSMDGSRVFYEKNCPRVEIEITELKESEVEIWKG